MNLLLGECHQTSLMTSQHWFRQWHQAITWANVDPDLYCHMLPPGHNGIIAVMQHICCAIGFIWYSKCLHIIMMAVYMTPDHLQPSLWPMPITTYPELPDVMVSLRCTYGTIHYLMTSWREVKTPSTLLALCKRRALDPVPIKRPI